MLTPFWLAVQFLTRLPTPVLQPTPADLGRSLLMYPGVGLLLGGLLALAGMGLVTLPGGSSLLMAALLLALWVILTGALHLDGLADSVDAWVGSHREPERARAIMQDPASGPMAVAAIGLLLLVKFAALVVLVETAAWLALVVTVLLGRAAMPLLFLCLPYVRERGLGSAMATNLPRTPAWIVLGATGLLILVLALTSAAWSLLAGLLMAIALVLGMVVFLRRWLGGFTGDTAGATLELVEVGALVVMMLLWPVS